MATRQKDGVVAGNGRTPRPDAAGGGRRELGAGDHHARFDKELQKGPLREPITAALETEELSPALLRASTRPAPYPIISHPVWL